MLSAIGTALSGLDAASKKLEASADNVANLDTVGSLDGSGQAPYTPLTTAQSAGADGGVTTNIVPQNGPAFTPSYDPSSPFANAQGLVGAPNVDLATEAVNMIIAKTAYKANAEVIKTQNSMDDALLNTFDEKA